MSEESSAAPQAKAVDFAGQPPVDPAADEEAHVPQPLDPEVLSVMEREDSCTWEAISVLS